MEIPEGHSIGSEQREYRPWVVVSAKAINEELAVVIAVPLTDQLDKPDRKYRVRIRGQEKIADPGEKGCSGESVALAEQVRVLSTDRLPNRRSARLTASAMARIEVALAVALGLPAMPPKLGGPLQPPLSGSFA